MTGLLYRVKSKLSIRAHRRVRGVLDGEYASVMHGKSHEFDELRPYVPGDEVRDIDWKATARNGTPYTRLYVAMRKHLVTFVVDTGRNMAAVGASGEPKRETAVLVAGILAYLAHRHGDHMSLVCGDADGVVSLPAAGTESHVEQVLAKIQSRAVPDAGRSDLNRLLTYVVRRTRRRSILVIISDDEGIDDERARMLRRLHAQHELLWVSIADADPLDPNWRTSPIVDIADGALLPDAIRRSSALHREFAASVATSSSQTIDTLESLGITGVRITGADGAVSGVFALLERHNHGRR
ncbi:DUF58 domain-containing protein [Microbacterium sp. MPKO10]|uniref:DUF58 domain-containing protein n=1 Tax=Microbacterium sp. MPKO10 TaxID=2989818 RepID=UPI0022367CAC|nr:DUF58 domain-containing protein [Microbacterium sp. MPKO10]MCW4458339.1 DUF58 domain-containing protein [Microbacterium sp. MPKO10]